MPWERPIKIARKLKKTGLIYAVSLKLVQKDMVVYHVEGLLQVNGVNDFN